MVNRKAIARLLTQINWGMNVKPWHWNYKGFEKTQICHFSLYVLLYWALAE